MTLPSVIGRPLAEARAILEAAHLHLAAVNQTSPPRAAPAGPLRVVRQRATPAGVELVLAASVPLAEGKNSDE